MFEGLGIFIRLDVAARSKVVDVFFRGRLED